MPAAALAEAVGSLPGETRPPLRFDSLRPASPAAAGQWQRAPTFARGLLDDDQAAASPLIIASTARLLAATALAVFPNTSLTDPAVTDSRDAHPTTT